MSVKEFLAHLKKEERKIRKKEMLEKMRYTRQWAKKYGLRKKPKWENYLTSRQKEIVALAEGYYSYFGFATRIRKRKTKKGTVYTLQLYDSLARRLK